MFLNDERYEDEKGNYLEKSEIDCLGTYEYGVDSFFKWSCGSCSHESRSRAYKIGGVIFTCDKCNKKNLLVRTDIKFVNQKMRNADRNDTTAEEAIRRALHHLGQGIAELGRR